MTEARLEVARADSADRGRGVARLQHDTLIDLGVSPGDVVAIEAEDATVATVWRADEETLDGDATRIDRFVRRNAGASVGDSVTLRPVDPAPAEAVVLAPVDAESFTQSDNVAGMVKRELVKRPLMGGDLLAVTSYGKNAGPGSTGASNVLVAVETSPDGPLVVTEDTEVRLRKTPAGDSDEAAVATDVSERDGTVTYEDVGGLDEEIGRIREMVELPMRYPGLFERLGIEPPKGVLLHGPPGTGKTLMARAIASESEASFFSIAGPEIISRYYGQSEQQLRDTFESAKDAAPAIVFVDELDAIAPKREEVSGDVERRVVAQLLTLLDGLVERGQITVIGTTNRLDAVDSALRRPGRFDREIEIGVPDEAGREEILRIHTRGMPLADDVDLERLAENTQGFVGADLANLTREAAMHAVRTLWPDVSPGPDGLDGDELDADGIDPERLDGTPQAGAAPEEAALDPAVLESIVVTRADFRAALGEVEPSALREVYVEVPDVTWDDVGGLQAAKRRLRETVQWPLEYPEVYEDASLETARGVLLYGPPGTGKTLLAKAVANESRSNFVPVKGPELFDRYVGESERAVREVFAKARENAPCVVFFDEIDAIAATRDRGAGEAGVAERVVSQLLTELDGLEDLGDVVVVATTNRPDLIDDALLRPGRLDRHVHVGVPTAAERREIFAIHTADRPLASDVDVEELVARTNRFTGVDVEVLCREATTIAVREHILRRKTGDVTSRVRGDEGPTRARDADAAAEDGTGGDTVGVTMDHFEQALEDVDPHLAEDEGPFEGTEDDFGVDFE